MSTNNARSQMVMRAFVQQNTKAGDVDGFNNPLPEVWEAKATVPCYAWSNAKRDAVDVDKTALVEDLRCTMPIDAAVTSADRIQKITDRREAASTGTGRVHFALPLRIETVQTKTTHLELNLRVIA